jgi:hypothetical protein
VLQRLQQHRDLSPQLEKKLISACIRSTSSAWALLLASFRKSRLGMGLVAA